MSEAWQDVGPADGFQDGAVHEVTVAGKPVAVSWKDGAFGAVSGVCNHVGGPLGQGSLDGDYLVCPWHYYKFHRVTGDGEPGFEADRVPHHRVKVEGGRLLVEVAPASKRNKLHHDPHPLERALVREPGPTRVVGISTTMRDPAHPRYSTSQALLEHALAAAGEQGCETRLIELAGLRFRACEGFYSKAARACTWPCSITQMDPDDQLDQVYEALVHWADVLILATPIRWGAASSLFFRMAERLNCVQNQITTHDRVLIRDKVAAFVITGGQDNIQGVAGQLLTFFAELGFSFPQFPFIAHSRGWSAEDMENNVDIVQHSDELRDGARALAGRAIEHSRMLLEHHAAAAKTSRGGRKAHRLG